MSRKWSLLYVEDEVFLGKIVKETLESKGYLVEMETSGATAIQKFDTLRPDLCILDIMLPDKNGFEVAEEIRAIHAQVPILFLTAKVQTEDVVRGFKSGGNDYIRKPFSMEELIVRIENLLQIRSNTVVLQEEEEIGQFRFLVKKQLLVSGTDSRKLSFRESELLKFLWQNRNTIVQRRDLLQHIWGNDSFFNSRNLDVYITKLRSYLREDPGIEILTIKGVGYRFVVD
jgi:DNA-binding response OmpR family regulator